MRFPGKDAPGRHLGPPNALHFIGFDRGRRNRAAKSTISMKFRFFMGGNIFLLPSQKHLYYQCF